jgi:hypothetical protein
MKSSGLPEDNTDVAAVYISERGVGESRYG